MQLMTNTLSSTSHWRTSFLLAVTIQFRVPNLTDAIGRIIGVLPPSARNTSGTDEGVLPPPSVGVTPLALLHRHHGA